MKIAQVIYCRLGDRDTQYYELINQDDARIENDVCCMLENNSYDSEEDIFLDLWYGFGFHDPEENWWVGNNHYYRYSHGVITIMYR